MGKHSRAVFSRVESPGVRKELQLEEPGGNPARPQTELRLGIDSVIDSAGRTAESLGVLRLRDFHDWPYPGGLSAARFPDSVVTRFI